MAAEKASLGKMAELGLMKAFNASMVQQKMFV
jgi:hypothetical protein